MKTPSLSMRFLSFGAKCAICFLWI